MTENQCTQRNIEKQSPVYCFVIFISKTLYQVLPSDEILQGHPFGCGYMQIRDYLNFTGGNVKTIDTIFTGMP